MRLTQMQSECVCIENRAAQQGRALYISIIRQPLHMTLQASDPVSYFWSGDALRSRSVSARVFSGVVDVPQPPVRLMADWQRESVLQSLEPGDVESLPLARARMRWPQYRQCVEAVADWIRGLGLQDALAGAEVALMACRGARYHHDGAQYGGAAFCNLFLSEDQGLDVHFPAAGQRIALVRGTVLVFDTCQPHAVVARSSTGFDVADFADRPERTSIFLTWELPLDDARLVHLLGIGLDTDAARAAQLHEEQVWVNAAPASVCPQSGRWRTALDA